MLSLILAVAAVKKRSTVIPERANYSNHRWPG
jgi:hypothetical protein